jgi:hypothetical protein
MISRGGEGTPGTTDEELLNEAVAEAADEAAHQDRDEVEATLRASMAARGLAPDDTAPLAKGIADAADEA